MKRLLLTATALTALAAASAPAMANELRLETGIAAGEIRAGGLGVDTRGLYIELEGHYVMGLSFGAELTAGRIGSGAFATTDTQPASGYVAYRIGTFGVGPAIGFDYVSFAGLSDDRVTAG